MLIILDDSFRGFRLFTNQKSVSCSVVYHILSCLCFANVVTLSLVVPLERRALEVIGIGEFRESNSSS